MGSRVKEEERNEKAIRGLLKLPGNRRCVNCNSLGPQYVCTSFSTFICTSCSGIHREFTHRVKSISMAKFTSQEVSALQEGGNERAKEIYFKHWDFQCQSVPDSSDVDALRNFIRSVYVDQRYTGEGIGHHPPKVKANQEGSYGNSNVDPSRRVLGRPYDGNYEHNSIEQSGTGSPTEDPSNLKRHLTSGRTDKKDRAPTGTDNTNFWNHQHPDETPKPSGRSENHQKGVITLFSSVVETSKDISTGVLPVRLPEPPRFHKATTSKISAEAQKTASPRANDPSPGTLQDVKLDMSKSLIDFDAELELPQSGVQTEIHKRSSLLSADVGWATFDDATPEKERVKPLNSSANSLEGQLLQLSTSAPVPAPQSGFATVQIAKVLSFPQANCGDQQNQLYLSPAYNMQSNNPPLNRPNHAPANNQPWGAASHVPLQGSSPIPEEATSNQRKALPEDIFTMGYTSVSTSAWGWQANPRVNMDYRQYGLQYPVGAVNRTPALVHPNSINPFNTAQGHRLVHASTFPSLTSLQRALPDMGGSTSSSHASSMGSFGSAWLPPQFLHSLAAQPSQYMVQQQAVSVPHQEQNNMYPAGYQGARGSFFSGTDQRAAAQDQSSFPRVGGNPFV